MKKILLFTVITGISISVFGQNTSNTSLPLLKMDPSVYNRVELHNNQLFVGNEFLENPKPNVNSGIIKRAAFPEVILGTSLYDLQTNSSVCNRVVNNSDGTISATWTMSQSANFSDRGTGYNYFDGTSWGAAPTTLVESVRVGWPSIGVTATGAEVIVSHEASAVHFASRAAKGTGPWTETTPVGAPDVWPRLAVGGANGQTVHIISQTSGIGNPPFKGQDGAVVYSRSLDGGTTWDKVHTVIAEIDSSNYLGFGGDTYAIDSRGDTVVIALGGFEVDVVLLKSTDNGDTWTKTIVKQFPIPLYDNATMTTDVDGDGIVDTIQTNDGSIAVLLDNNGQAHVWYGNMRIINDAPGSGGVSYFPGTNGLSYWNESMSPNSPVMITQALDLDNNGVLDISDWGTYQVSLSSHANAGVDADNNIYLSYAAIVEGTDAGDGKSYRHTYMMVSLDGGTTWSNPVDIQSDNFTEAVYGAVAKRVDSNVHLVYQKSSIPGNALTTCSGNPCDPGNAGLASEMIYVAVPISSFTGISEENQNKIANVSIHPNPSSGSTEILFNMIESGTISVSILNMMGQEVASFSNQIENGGNYSMKLNLEYLAPGLYIVNSMSGNDSFSNKLIIK